MSDEAPLTSLPPDARDVRDSQGRRIFADDGTDLSLIREFLKKTPAERLQALQAMADLVGAVRKPSGRNR